MVSPYPASAGLDALVCGYSPKHRAEKLIAVMYQAFSDDSSSGEGGKTLLLAACVQRYQVWANFAFDWELALALPPSINYFKMREARLLIKEFAGWKASDRDRKIKSLTSVIMAFRPKIICAYVSRALFNETVGKVVPYALRHPYTLIFYPLIIKLAEWQHSAGITLPTDFVFDEQGDVGAETVLWYEYMKYLQPPHLQALMGSTPIFRDDKRILPLQAADLIAWHKRRIIDNPTENISRWPTAPIEELSYAQTWLTKQHLVNMEADMAQVPLVEHFHDKPKDYVPGALAGGMPMPKTKTEFENFDRTMQELIKVKHDDIKAKLDEEKAAKEKKRKLKKTSASGRASGGKD